MNRRNPSILRAVQFLALRILGERLFIISAFVLVAVFWTLFCAQTFLTIGSDSGFTELHMRNYLDSYGGRNAYYLTAILGTLYSARVFLNGENVFVYSLLGSRPWVFGANVFVALASGFAVALIYLTGQTSISLGFQLFSDQSPTFNGAYFLQSLFVMTLWGFLGYLFTLALRSPITSMVMLGSWFLLIEPMLGMVLSEYVKSPFLTSLLPGSLSGDIAWPVEDRPSDIAMADSGIVFSLLIFSAYCALLASICWYRSFRKVCLLRR